MSHRPTKRRLYAQFARVGRALASGYRLEVLELLAQAPRHVEALASETGMSIANVSQHLQVLRHAGLVDSEREGNKVVYRLTDEAVLHLWLSLRSVAAARLAEVDVMFGVLKGDRSREAVVDFEELGSLRDSGEVLLCDVRPQVEFEAGHLPGAVCVPVDDLPHRMDELPRDRLIIAYCRGKYCLLADKAVAILRMRGFRASRLRLGWSEWRDHANAVLSLAAG